MAVVSFLARVTLVLVVIVVLAMLLSGLGTRWGLWTWPTGLGILRWSTQIAIGLAVWNLVLLVAAIVLRTRREIVILAHAIVLVVIPLSYVLWHVQIARSVPAIHDITTDMDDPPEIRALAGVPERSLTYDRDNAPQQRAAYADIETIATDQPVDVVFRRALEVAAELGWNVVESEPPQRFQAVDTTLWFGFDDDIVVRVRPFGIGSVIDIRSASRVGRSDIGANAARIRAFRDALDPGFDPGSEVGWEIGTVDDFAPAPPEARREVRDGFVPPEDPAQ